MKKIKLYITDIIWEDTIDLSLPKVVILKTHSLSRISRAFEERYGQLPISYNLSFPKIRK